MDFATAEVAAIEQTSDEANESQAREVFDLRAAFAGGGSVTVIIG